MTRPDAATIARWRAMVREGKRPDAYTLGVLDALEGKGSPDGDLHGTPNHREQQAARMTLLGRHEPARIELAKPLRELGGYDTKNGIAELASLYSEDGHVRHLAYERLCARTSYMQICSTPDGLVGQAGVRVYLLSDKIDEGWLAACRVAHSISPMGDRAAMRRAAELRVPPGQRTYEPWVAIEMLLASPEIPSPYRAIWIRTAARVIYLRGADGEWACVAYDEGGPNHDVPATSYVGGVLYRLSPSTGERGGIDTNLLQYRVWEEGGRIHAAGTYRLIRQTSRGPGMHGPVVPWADSIPAPKRVIRRGWFDADGMHEE